VLHAREESKDKDGYCYLFNPINPNRSGAFWLFRGAVSDILGSTGVVAADTPDKRNLFFHPPFGNAPTDFHLQTYINLQIWVTRESGGRGPTIGRTMANLGLCEADGRFLGSNQFKMPSDLAPLQFATTNG